MRFTLAICLCLWGQTAFAQNSTPEVVNSHEVNGLGLTIYPQDLAMVTEVRTVDVPAGLSEIRFHGVTDMILPETAVLQSFEGLRLEGNFDSDLLSRNALLQKAVGTTIFIRRIDIVTGEAKIVEAELVSATPGVTGTEEAVFKTDEGLEALYCSGLSESVIFSDIPDTLYPVPMLSMVVQAEAAGKKEITLTYLTRGIGWEADYRMDVTEVEPEKASLLGWLTLKNKTSKSFKNTGLAVVAGQVNRANANTNSPNNRQVSRRVNIANCGDNVIRRGDDEIVATGYKLIKEDVVVQYESAPVPELRVQGLMMESSADIAEVSVREATQEELGDYKLYRAPQAVSVDAMQTKQIAFLLNSDVEYETLHRRIIDFAQPVQMLTNLHETQVTYDIDNDADGNLSKPLPKGTLRVMSVREDGRTVFTGEDKVTNLAIDLPFEVDIAQSFLVTTAFRYNTVETDDGLSLKLSTDIRNATDKAAIAEIEFRGVPISAISASNFDRDTDEALPTYRLPVSAESEETLTLTLPLSQEVEIQHDTKRYKTKTSQLPTYEAEFAASRFKFRGELKERPYLTRLLTEKRGRKIIFEATQTSTDMDGEGWISRGEKFVFTNPNETTLDVNFSASKENKLGQLLESSIDPVAEDWPYWRFTLLPNSKRTLTTKIRAPR